MSTELTVHANLDADEVVEQLYAAHWRPLVRLSVLLGQNLSSAEGIVQDAFVRTHGRWSRLRDPEKALRHLRHEVIDRSRPRVRPHPAADAQRSRDTAVLGAMRRLPQRQREVLALGHYLALSEAEIAELLGISTGAVSRNASRGAAALRSHLEDLR